MPTIRLAKTVGGQTATVELRQIDDDKLGMVLAINGHTTDTDVAEYDTTEDRDAALAETLRLYESRGYVRYAERPQAVDTEYLPDGTAPIRLSSQILAF